MSWANKDAKSFAQTQQNVRQKPVFSFTLSIVQFLVKLQTIDRYNKGRERNAFKKRDTEKGVILYFFLLSSFLGRRSFFRCFARTIPCSSSCRTVNNRSNTVQNCLAWAMAIYLSHILDPNNTQLTHWKVALGVVKKRDGGSCRDDSDRKKNINENLSCLLLVIILTKIYRA